MGSMVQSNILSGFLLSRHIRDLHQGLQLDYWLATSKGAVCVQQSQQQRVCFIDIQQQEVAEQVLNQVPYSKTKWQLKPTALKCFTGTPALALYISGEAVGRELQQRLQDRGVRLMEEDIRPEERFLMERFITGAMDVSLNDEQVQQLQKTLALLPLAIHGPKPVTTPPRLIVYHWILKPP